MENINSSVRQKEADPLRSLKKRISHIRALPVSIALILLATVTLPLPVKISHTFSGIRWESGDMQTEEECEVTVDGWYYRYLLKDNIFKGSIRFSASEGTASFYVPEAALCRGALYEDRGGSLTVYDAARNQMRTLGSVAVSGNFREIFIHSEEGNFSAPAGNRSEAVELAEELTTEEWWY